ncbi:MAG TPA: hypothetical protein VLV32_00195 [Burkholderiales bacterium]|nr:hypothetical protein [Burkholderiales bacterium]
MAVLSHLVSLYDCPQWYPLRDEVLMLASPYFHSLLFDRLAYWGAVQTRVPADFDLGIRVAYHRACGFAT